MALKEAIGKVLFMPGTNYEGWPALGFHVAWVSALLGGLFGETIFHFGWPFFEYSFFAVFYCMMAYLVIIGAVCFYVTLLHGDVI